MRAVHRPYRRATEVRVDGLGVDDGSAAGRRSSLLQGSRAVGVVLLEGLEVPDVPGHERFELDFDLLVLPELVRVGEEGVAAGVFARIEDPGCGRFVFDGEFVVFGLGVDVFGRLGGSFGVLGPVVECLASLPGEHEPSGPQRGAGGAWVGCGGLRILNPGQMQDDPIVCGR